MVFNRHNMQKVVYVLLKQHSEKYWQADHGDEVDDEMIGRNHYSLFESINFSFS